MLNTQNSHLSSKAERNNSEYLIHNKGFWASLPKPFFAMALMSDVTDSVYRSIFDKYGKPDITWTEFVSADGLFLRPINPPAQIIKDINSRLYIVQQIANKHCIGIDHPLLYDLIYDELERPTVAQFFSRDPGRMARAASLAHDLGFDGIDINMGCPSDVICKQGAGAAIMKEPELAKKIIKATIKGANGLPVSVKTRIGFDKNEIETWLPVLLEAHPVAITIHARTRKEMSKVPAHWDIIARAVEIRNKIAPDVLIIGNGDIASIEEAHARVAETNCDGVMIGRGIIGNPWFFNKKIKKENLSSKDIMQALLEHTKLFEEQLGDIKSFAIMKKHFKAYLHSISNSKHIISELMEKGNSYKDVEDIANPLLSR